MKFFKIVIISLLITGSFTCKAQDLERRILIPVENTQNYLNAGNELPDNAYFVDAHHLFDNFVGTWSGNYEGKTYLINIEKNTYTFMDIRKDRLLLRYKITDAHGQVLANTLEKPLGITVENPLGNTYLIKGRYFFENNDHKYLLLYVGPEFDCGQSGNIVLKSGQEGNQLKLKLEPSQEWTIGFNCPSGERAEQVFPTERFMTLTRK